MSRIGEESALLGSSSMQHQYSDRGPFQELHGQEELVFPSRKRSASERKDGGGPQWHSGSHAEGRRAVRVGRQRSGSLSALDDRLGPRAAHPHMLPPVTEDTNFLVTEGEWRKRFWGSESSSGELDGSLGSSGAGDKEPHFPTDDGDATTMLRDKGNASYLIILLLGAGFMFPFFSFTSAVNFMRDQYPSFPEVISNLSTSYNLGGFVIYFLVLLYLGKFTIRSRILLCFSLEFVLISVAPFWHIILDNEQVAVWLLYCSLFVMGCLSGVLNATVMGLAALFPSSYSQAALFGAGAAGTFITLIRVFTKLAIPDTTNLVFSSSVYFGLSAFIVLCCVVCYLLLLRLDYAQHHMRREFTRSSLRSRDLGDEESGPTDRDALLLGEPPRPALHTQKSASGGDLVVVEEGEEKGEEEEEDDTFRGALSQKKGGKPQGRRTEGKLKSLPSLRELWRMFRRCFPMFLSAFLTFFLTLTLYPGILVAIPEHSLGLTDGWWPLMLLCVWNVSDFIGRGLPNFVQLFSPKAILVPVLLRFLLAPLVFLCVKPLVLEADWLVICLAVVFGFSNGYLGTLSMMYGSAGAEREEDLESTGILMSFGLNLGLVAGSSFSTLLAFLLDIH